MPILSLKKSVYVLLIIDRTIIKFKRQSVNNSLSSVPNPDIFVGSFPINNSRQLITQYINTINFFKSLEGIHAY